MKIAILQNRIGLGGRNVVISEFIRLCNDRQMHPVVFTFSNVKDRDKFKAEYGVDLSFDLNHIKGLSMKRGTAYETPLLNILSVPNLKRFTLVFNSGRCPYFLPKGPKYIHYVHFPLEASLYNEEHFQNLKGRLYTFPLKVLYKGKTNKVNSGIFLANSIFTAKAIKLTYPSLDDQNIQVVYPPCRMADLSNNKQRDLDFISLGSFISDKRQLEQIEIARKLSRCKFSLIGGLKSKKYFDKCREVIKETKIENVKLFPNATKDAVSNLLSRSRVYLHTKHSEHFGISTVEAIAHGCIPLVHDSGGSCEIVPLKKLRFKTTEEAIIRGKHITDNFDDYAKEYGTFLMNHIQQYSDITFQDKIRSLLFRHI